MGQRDAETHVAEDVPQCRIRLVRLVGLEMQHRTGQVLRSDGDVLALLFIALVERPVGGVGHPAEFDVHLAADEGGVLNLPVLQQLDERGVDVGQLVAGLIGLPVVGIALEEPVGLGLFEEPVGAERGQVGIVLRNAFVQARPVAEQGHPAVHAPFLGLRLQLLNIHIAGMELLAVVLGMHNIGPVVMGQVLQDERIGVREDELDRVVVHPLEVHEVAAGLEPARLVRGQFVVQHVDVPELEVVGGVRMAVGPLGAAPQVQGEFPPVRADVEALNNVGHHRGEVRADTANALLAHAGAAAVEGTGSRIADREHAAIGAHFVPGLDDLRVERQPFLDRRQVTGSHPLGQQG